jgi:hypothetical protein
MTERPLAKFEDGRLWLDKGISGYEPVSRSEVNILRAGFAHYAKPSRVLAPLSADYERQLSEVINQHDKAMEEAKCEAATH